LHFGLDGGKAAVVSPTPSLPGLAPTSEPPLNARGGAGFWRLFLGSSLFAAVAATLAASLSPGRTTLSMLAFLVAMKLARVPPPAHPRPS
jgi:hypothetical protein